MHLWFFAGFRLYWYYTKADHTFSVFNGKFFVSGHSIYNWWSPAGLSAHMSWRGVENNDELLETTTSGKNANGCHTQTFTKTFHERSGLFIRSSCLQLSPITLMPPFVIFQNMADKCKTDHKSWVVPGGFVYHSLTFENVRRSYFDYFISLSQSSVHEQSLCSRLYGLRFHIDVNTGNGEQRIVNRQDFAV